MLQRCIVKGFLPIACLALLLVVHSGAVRGQDGAHPPTPHQQWRAATLGDLAHYQPSPQLAAATDASSSPAVDPHAESAMDSDHRLVYESYERREWNIYYNGRSGNPPLLLAHTTESELHPRLNRGATRIVFSSDRDGDYDLFLIDPDGTNLVQLTQNDWDDVTPYWSPDGEMIVFESYRDQQPEIYVMNADGSNQQRLTQHPSFDGVPTWSPDGSSILFTSYRDGFYQIYRVKPDGSDLTRLTTPFHSLYAFYSPDNLTIAFSGDSDGDGWLELWTMGADGGNPQPIWSGAAQTDFMVNGWYGNAPQQFVVGTEVHFVFQSGDWYWYEAQPFEFTLNSGMNSIASGSGLAWSPDVASIDDRAPVMPAILMPEYSLGEVAVNWLEAPDSGGSGTYGYEKHVQELPGGAWQVLQRQDPANELRLTLPAGKSYRFRVRALDGAYNYSDWLYTAPTTVYTWKLDSRVTDNRGNALAHATVQTNPPSFLAFERGDLYTNYMGDEASPFTASWSLPGYGSPPDGIFGLGDGHVTAQVVLPPANDVIEDGDFESGALAGWHTSHPQLVILNDSDAHTGLYSVFFMADAAGTSISQTVSVPSTMPNPTLSFNYMLSAEIGTTPRLEVQIDDGSSTQTVSTLSGAQDEWRHGWADLSAWQGETITITFYRPGGVRAANLDDVSLGSTSPDLWLANSGALTAFPGETVSRTLAYGNSGGVAAPGSTLTLTLPAELTLAGASPMPAGDGPYTWDLGNLAAGDGGSIALELTMAGGVDAGETVTAAVQISTPYEAYLANNEMDLAFLVGREVLLPFIVR